MSQIKFNLEGLEIPDFNIFLDWENSPILKFAKTIEFDYFPFPNELTEKNINKFWEIMPEIQFSNDKELIKRKIDNFEAYKIIFNHFKQELILKYEKYHPDLNISNYSENIIYSGKKNYLKAINNPKPDKLFIIYGKLFKKNRYLFD